jgi:hypothetical protein
VSAPFFSTKQLASYRGLVGHTFQTDIEVWKRDANPAPEANVYGDDGETWAYAETVSGWVFSVPTPAIEVYAGRMGLLNTYRLFLPVGTDVASGDQVVAEGQRFVVSDTVKESTWLPLLRCSLRTIE